MKVIYHFLVSSMGIRKYLYFWQFSINFFDILQYNQQEQLVNDTA